MGGSYSGQALELIRPETAVSVLGHALARASGVMSLGMGVGGQDTGGEEDDTNRGDKRLKPSRAGSKPHKKNLPFPATECRMGSEACQYQKQKRRQTF